jgi:phage tail-like protein
VQVRNFKAESNSRGGRIDLSWLNPDATEFPRFKGVKILRREFTFPTIEDIGTARQIHDDATTPAGAAAGFSDGGLKGNTVYYYAIVAYDQANNHSALATASALATTPYQTADELYRNLPALYQRFDTVVPPLDVPVPDEADKTKGQLRRLIEMFGLQFDLLRSFAGGMRDFSDVERIDGALLPLLADWIGWQTDFTLPPAKQRNEIEYAPHFYRTTGIAANLRATLNRLTTWDAQVKEFVHNVFLTNAPEQLFIQETERRDKDWKEEPLVKPVTLDVAYEGRPAVVRSNDGRIWLFYHARQSVPQPGTKTAADHWHLWYKLYDQPGWLPARRLTFDGDLNKYPAALQTRDGNLWVFRSSAEGKGSEHMARIKLQIISAGRPAQPPQLRGTQAELFNFADGDEFKITINDGVTSIERTVTFRPEHFQDMTKATAADTAALLDRELPGVEVTAVNGQVVITSLAAGAGSTLTLPASAVATKLGLTGSATGSDASRAQLISRAGPFNIAARDRLIIKVDNNPAHNITFGPGPLTAAQASAAINSLLPGVAEDESGKLKLASLTAGESSFIAVDADASTVAPKLGFGAQLPQSDPPAADTEPTAFEDNAGNVWLFWSSRRDGDWRIWYNRFDAASGSWGAAKRLTSGIDREPAVAFDPAGGAANQGKIWVFWSRKKSDGRLNIFYRTTTKIDFNALADGDWTELELIPPPTDYERREPSPVLLSTDNVELFFTANRRDGWHVWMNALTPAPLTEDRQITSGQFTSRAPAAVKTGQGVRLWFRSSESQVYVSPSYPASQTIDARYAGSTTVDTRNAAKIGLRRNLQDTLRYTYDTGRADDDWYARDTVGIHLIPDTEDEGLILRKQSAIANVVRNFLPIQVRAVFIIQQVYVEYVYTYARPDATPQVLIGERMIDTILSEVYTGLSDSYRDRVDFRFVRTWRAGLPKKGVVDTSVTPPDLSFRLFMRGVEEGA